MFVKINTRGSHLEYGVRPLPACLAGEAVWEANTGAFSFFDPCQLVWQVKQLGELGGPLASQTASPARQAGRGREPGTACSLASQTGSPARQAGRGLTPPKSGGTPRTRETHHGRSAHRHS